MINVVLNFIEMYVFNIQNQRVFLNIIKISITKYNFDNTHS